MHFYYDYSLLFLFLFFQRIYSFFFSSFEHISNPFCLFLSFFLSAITTKNYFMRITSSLSEYCIYEPIEQSHISSVPTNISVHYDKSIENSIHTHTKDIVLEIYLLSFFIFLLLLLFVQISVCVYGGCCFECFQVSVSFYHSCALFRSFLTSIFILL